MLSKSTEICSSRIAPGYLSIGKWLIHLFWEQGFVSSSLTWQTLWINARVVDVASLLRKSASNRTVSSNLTLSVWNVVIMVVRQS